jgi:hypothetical protein
VRCKPLAELECFAGRAHLRKRARGMGMQVILDPTNALHLRVVFVKQVGHKFSLSNSRASGSPCHRPQPGLWLKGQTDTARPLLLIRIMVALRFARAHREDRAHIAKEQAWTFIKTNERAPWIIW